LEQPGIYRGLVAFRRDVDYPGFVRDAPEIGAHPRERCSGQVRRRGDERDHACRMVRMGFESLPDRPLPVEDPRRGELEVESAMLPELVQ
jgi:hypothetical protein